MATETQELIPVEAKQLMKQALEFVGTLTEIKTSTEQEYQNVVELCKSCKSLFKTLEEKRDSLVRPFNTQVDEINAEFKVVTSKLKNGEKVIKDAMSKYAQEQEPIRIEEQRKLNAIAEERRKKADEAAQKELDKANAYREQGRDEMADKAEARAETKIEVATTIVAPVVESKAKAQGASFKTTWTVRITDLRAAVLFCIDNPMFQNHVTLDTKALDRVAQAAKGNLPIPGIEVNKSLTPILRG